MEPVCKQGGKAGIRIGGLSLCPTEKQSGARLTECFGGDLGDRHGGTKLAALHQWVMGPSSLYIPQFKEIEPFFSPCRASGSLSVQWKCEPQPGPAHRCGIEGPKRTAEVTETTNSWQGRGRAPWQLLARTRQTQVSDPCRSPPPPES